MSKTDTDKQSLIYSHMEWHAGLHATAVGKQASNLGFVDHWAWHQQSPGVDSCAYYGIRQKYCTWSLHDRGCYQVAVSQHGIVEFFF